MAMEFTKETLLEIRVNLDMSLEEFAKVIGVSTSTIQAWETGRTKPNRTNCRKLEMKLKKFYPLCEQTSWSSLAQS